MLGADAYVLAEVRRNLVNKGPAALPVLEALLAHLQIAPTLVGAAGAGELDWLPPKDRPLLAAAIRLRYEALATGNRTLFGSAYGLTIGGVTIHSPRSLADAVSA